MRSDIVVLRTVVRNDTVTGVQQAAAWEAEQAPPRECGPARAACGECAAGGKRKRSVTVAILASTYTVLTTCQNLLPIHRTFNMYNNPGR